MKKIVALFLCLLCVAMLGACGNNQNTADESAKPIESENETTENVSEKDNAKDFSEIYSEMEKILPEMTELNKNSILNLYGIEEAMYTEIKVVVASDGLLADEVWLIKAKDEASLQSLKKSAENRITAKDEESITYSPEQNKIVKAGKIVEDGLNFALIVSPDVAELVKIFNQ